MEEDIKLLAEKAAKLNIQIKRDEAELRDIKNKIIKNMTDNNKSKLIHARFSINKFNWKSRFSSYLDERVYKIDENQKDELIKKGLLKIRFLLNNKKYQEIKDRKEKNVLDEYVKEKRAFSFLRFKYKTDKNYINQEDDKNEENISLEEHIKITHEIPVLDEKGFDDYGFDGEGFDREGYDEDNYDRDGEWKYAEDGQDEDGYNEQGYNDRGYDRTGAYDEEYDIVMDGGYEEDNQELYEELYQEFGLWNDDWSNSNTEGWFYHDDDDGDHY